MLGGVTYKPLSTSLAMPAGMVPRAVFPSEKLPCDSKVVKVSCARCQLAGDSQLWLPKGLTMSESLFPPTINDRVNCVSSEIGGEMPESCHCTSMVPAGTNPPALGDVNLTSATVEDAKRKNERTAVRRGTDKETSVKRIAAVSAMATSKERIVLSWMILLHRQLAEDGQKYTPCSKLRKEIATYLRNGNRISRFSSLPRICARQSIA